MKRVFLTLAVVLGLCGMARAQDSAVEGVIQSQIDAFLADDFDSAYAHASPMIKGMFGSAERFGAMVRQGYPMVHRPRDVQFLELRQENGRIVQKILVRDQAGAFHALEYEMIETETGWQINGVQLLQAAQVGA